MNEFDRKSDKEKFEEEFGSVENFSRKHVESLFDDDPPHPPLIPPSKTGAGSGIKAHEDMDEDEIAKQALINGIFGEGAGSDLPRRPPYQRMGKASDPEAEYQAYLDLATEESRKEQQKKQADKEGRRAIFLETRSCNKHAIAFYLKQGFALIGFDSCAFSKL